MLTFLLFGLQRWHSTKFDSALRQKLISTIRELLKASFKPSPQGFGAISGGSRGTNHQLIIHLLSSLAPAPLCSSLKIQLSKSQFRYERSRADAIITVHHHHQQQQLLKSGRMMIFTLFQLTNKTKDIFHL